MENRNIHGCLEAVLYLEALGCLDILQVDSAEGRSHKLDRINKGLGVAAVQLQVKDIHICKAFEEDSLPFHNRLSCIGAYVAQSKDSSTIGYHTHQVLSSGVGGYQALVCLYLQTWESNTRCIGTGEVILSLAWL